MPRTKQVSTKKKGEIVLHPSTSTKIYQPNRVTNGRYKGFTLMQGKVFVTIIKGLQAAVKSTMESGIKQLSLFEETERGDIKIPITLSDITSSPHYQDVILAIKDFMKISLEIKSDTEGYRRWANFIPIMDEPVIVNKKTVVYVHIIKQVADTLLSFKRNYQGKPIEFTQYIYEVVMAGKSQYTPVIYPLVSSWKHKRGFKISLVDLRNLIGLNPTQYSNYSDFKRFVLKPVQKDLEKKADCWFNCSAHGFEEKQGKRVVMLNFKIIVPEVEELQQVKYQSFKDMLIRHWEFSPADIERISTLFVAQIPFEQLSDKMMELHQYLQDPQNLEQINNKKAYIIQSLLNAFM